MLDYIELNASNHFFDAKWLYVKIDSNVYRFLIKFYKNLVRNDKAYILTYHNEFVEYNFAFYDEKVRDWYWTLIKINSIGIRTVDLIIKEFTLTEFEAIVKNFDYQKLMQIKGIGEILSKTIIDYCQKELLNFKLTEKDETIIRSLTKLGYSRKVILQKWPLIDHKLNTDEFVKELLILLGKTNEQTK